MFARLIALLLPAIVGCNAVLGLDERDRAPDDSSVDEDVSVSVDSASDTEPVRDTAEDTGTAVDSGTAVDGTVDSSTPMFDTGTAVDTGTPPCSGYTTCPSGCTDTKRDPLSCGGCGLRCERGQACVDGACVCLPGGEMCAGGKECRPVSRESCSKCGDNCPFASGMPYCDTLKRTCTSGCPTGTTACGTYTCVNLSTNHFNCGGCGKVCNVGEVCAASVCQAFRPPTPECPTGYTVCPGFFGSTATICVKGDKC